MSRTCDKANSLPLDDLILVVNQRRIYAVKGFINLKRYTLFDDSRLRRSAHVVMRNKI